MEVTSFSASALQLRPHKPSTGQLPVQGSPDIYKWIAQQVSGTFLVMGMNLPILKVPIQTMHAYHNRFIALGIAAPT